jgi:phage terminase large subunit GpA-like protein
LLIRPSEQTTPDRWAVLNRTYPQSAPIPGPRDPYLTPYIIEPELVVAACGAKRIVMVTASQSGKTEMMLDIAGSRLDQKPAPILYVGPNKQFLTEQFEPRVMALLDSAPTLTNKLARGKRMTKTRKMIAGVSFRLAHAGSSAALKSDPAALALVDEYDEMLANIKGQGDPLGLVERRGDTYPDFVAVVTSTCKRGMVQPVHDDKSGLDFWAPAPPEDIYESPIWALWQEGTRHHWAWPCPHCADFFIPRFDLLRYPEGVTPIEAAKGVYIECPHCGGVVEEHHKLAMNEHGRYVAPGQSVDKHGVVTGEPPQASTISFWVSGLASPFVSFGDRVRSYLEAVALADDAMIQTAMNAGFGELYAPGGRDIREWQQVASRRQPHRFGEVPDGVLKLTAAVDVQSNGFFYSIRGWGARATSWQIESGEIVGFTNEPEVWNDLANVVLATYGDMHISLCLVDSGFRPNKPNEGPTNVVYDFCRRFRRFCKPTKGYDRLSAPVMRGKAKVTIPGGRAPVSLELVRLDTDFWKSRLMERLSWPEEQPGGFLLSADASDDYCRQIVSETRKVTPSGKAQWVTISRRNHFLDCEAMNEAAGHMLAAQKIPLGAKRSEPVPSVVPGQPPAMPAFDPRKMMSEYAGRINK